MAWLHICRRVRQTTVNGMMSSIINANVPDPELVRVRSQLKFLRGLFKV